MTYLEVAEAILKQERRPLHYKEITKLAQERGLLQTEGQTPAASMGASLYVAVKRSADRDEPCRVAAIGRGRFQRKDIQETKGLESEIRKHNDKVRTDLLEYLRDMHPRQLELIVGQLLTAIGFEDVVVTRYVGDKGIDAEATLTVGGVTRVRTAIQVKRYAESNKIGPSTVRELRGSLLSDQRGLIITTSSFNKSSIEEARATGKVPISLVDGHRLVDLLVDHQIGVRRKTVPLQELNLEELMVEEGEEGGAGEKSVVLWPLPGGQKKYFDTLLHFIDKIGEDSPTLEVMSEWVIQNYEKVTKHKLVRSYLRSVIYSMGLIAFDGEKVVLTETGEEFREKRDKGYLVQLLNNNILGISEILETLGKEPSSTDALLAMLNNQLNLSWQTVAQVNYRVQWLQTCGVIKKEGKTWRLVS